MPSYNTTTRGTLRQRVRERLLQNWWTDTELNLLINEALRMWGSFTGFYRQRSSVTFTSAQTDYPVTGVDPNCYAVLRIDLTSGIHLDPVAIEELGQFNPTWYNDTATAPTGWVPLGLNHIALYPVLTGSVTTTVDNLYFAPLPANDSVFIQVGEEDMDAIIDYIQFAANIKVGGDELQVALQLLNNFLQQCAKYNSRLLNSAIFRRVLGMPSGGQVNQRPRDLEGMAPR